jgi:glutamine synthetase
MLKEVTKKHGFFATYMPKPTQGDWRNGAHINHSVQQVDRPGVNLFEGANGDWSPVTFNVLGGLLKHGGALTCVACSTVNSYKGLIGRAGGLEGGTLTWAPTHMCYGTNNRSAMLRLPQTRKAIENRAADMALNAYLALAITIAASMEGITEAMPAPSPVNKPLYDITPREAELSGIQPLPGTLLEAVRLFDADPLVKQVLGPTMHDLYSRYKHDEWARFHEHVTEWERIEYLRFF